jgi:hypothetical protein
MWDFVSLGESATRLGEALDPMAQILEVLYSTRFELSDFKNSLKFLASAGIAIEGPSQEFERPQPLFDRAGQPVFNSIVRIRQADNGKTAYGLAGSPRNHLLTARS